MEGGSQALEDGVQAADPQASPKPGVEKPREDKGQKVGSKFSFRFIF